MSQPGRPAGYALNAIANGATVVFAALVSFFLSPFIVRHLGATQYGVWSLTAGLVGYLGLLDLGIRQAVSRYVARHRAASAHQDSSLIVSAALRLFGFLGLTAILLSAVLAYLAPLLFNIPEAMTNDARIIVLLGGLTLSISLVGGVFGGVVTGIERFDVQGVIEIAITSIRSIAIVIALSAGYGLVTLAVIQLVTSILNCGIYRAAAQKVYPELQMRWRGVLGPQMRTILSFSASLTVLYAVGRIISYTDTAIIGAFLPIDAVTSFVIASSLCIYAKEIPRSLSYQMAPRISAMTSVGHGGVGGEIAQIARIATLVSVPITLTFMLRGESFISLWMGHEYGPLSGQVLRVLALGVLLDASRSVVVLSFTGMAKQGKIIPGLAIEALCNLALSLILVRPLGIVGVALGTLIPGTLVTLVYLPRRLSKETGIAASDFCRKAVVIPSIACLPFGLATFAVEKFMPATNLLVFFLEVIVLLPCVPLVAWFVCFSPAERTRIGAAIKGLVRR